MELPWLPFLRWRGSGTTKLVIVLALVYHATAQDTNTSPPACQTWTDANNLDQLIIQNQNDIDALQGCEIIHQSLLFRMTRSPNNTIDLKSIKTVAGDVIVDSDEFTTDLIASELTEVGGSLILNDVAGLSQLSMPKLSSVGKQRAQVGGARFKLTQLPSLQSPGFSPQGITLYPSSETLPAPTLNISSTKIRKIDFINLPSQPDPTIRFGYVKIQGNQQLEEITLPNLYSSTQNIFIQGNVRNATVALENLSQVGELNIQQIQQVFMPKLVNVTQSLTIVDTDIDVLSFPVLAYVGIDLTISRNDWLGRIDMNALKDVGLAATNSTPGNSQGDLRMEYNSLLTTIAGFDSVDRITHGAFLTGDFDGIPMSFVSTFSKGAQLHIVSFNPAFSCAYYGSLVVKHWREPASYPPQSVYSCQSPNSNSNTNSNGTAVSPIDSIDLNGRTTLTKEVRGVLIGVLLVGGLLSLWMIYIQIKRRKAKRRELERIRAQRANGGSGFDDDAEWIQLSGGRRRRRGSTDQGVVRQVEEGGPPQYERVGKPGEVPPLYLEVMNSNTTDDQPPTQQDTAPPVSDTNANTQANTNTDATATPTPTPAPTSNAAGNPTQTTNTNPQQPEQARLGEGSRGGLLSIFRRGRAAPVSTV